jgi:adenylosuccinate synthase
MSCYATTPCVGGINMRYVFVISGPVGVGKSSFCDQFAQRFGAVRLSTPTILIDNGIPNERRALQDAGDALDQETDGKWVADGAAQHAQEVAVDGIAPIEIEHLRRAYGQRLVHVHLTASIDILRVRYLGRTRQMREFDRYDELKQNTTEANIEQLGRIADVQILTDWCEPKSLLARAVAGLGLYPSEPARLVDVVVGGQHGSEGKGNICSHLASGYDVLVRVGGPNAGHWASIPRPIRYVQLPSGTAANEQARILIGAGATIRIPQILSEIDEHKLGPNRLSIDPQAVIIEDQDVAYERTTLDVIGSTKQGVGAATARKLLGRDGREHLGSKVRLASNAAELTGFFRPVGIELERAYADGRRIMLEGTQGTDLRLHHASWPNVTSRETTASGCLADAGIAPLRVRRVIMVTRTYPIRVGGTSGPMGREIEMKVIAERSDLPLSEIEATEVGTISRNPRRVAEFDWEQLRRSAALNGVTDVALTFADYLSAENQGARRFEQLSIETQNFVGEVERVANAPVSLISTRFPRGEMPDKRCVIDRRTWR